MSVLLAIERSKAGALSAMLWTTGDDDPRLLESRKFRGEGALKVWLAGIVTRYGRRNIRVTCPESLEADDRLAGLLEESVGPIVPGAGPLRPESG